MAGRRENVTNPFYFGDLALDEAFTDRKDELKSLEADMRNGRNVALIAPRRYGKSSLVRRASQHLVRRGVLIADVDLMKTPTKERFASHLARAIHDGLASRMFKARDAALRVFDSLRVKPVVTLDPTDGSVGFTFSAAHGQAGIDDTIERLLALPAELAAEQGRQVVLVFDEFQEVTGIDVELPALMRAVFQDQPDVSHVYAGSKRDMMSRLFNHENEPFYRSAKVMEIGPIPPELFAPFIRARFDSTDRGVSDPAVDGLLGITHGHPYATQEFAYALWEEVPAGFSASASDLDKALDVVLRSENARFTLLWDGLSRAQRLLLQALAAEPGRVQSTAYRNAHGLPAASSVQRATDALMGAELVTRRADGKHEIVEPFLTQWIKRYAA